MSRQGTLVVFDRHKSFSQCDILVSTRIYAILQRYPGHPFHRGKETMEFPSVCLPDSLVQFCRYSDGTIIPDEHTGKQIQYMIQKWWTFYEGYFKKKRADMEKQTTSTVCMQSCFANCPLSCFAIYASLTIHSYCFAKQSRIPHKSFPCIDRILRVAGVLMTRPGPCCQKALFWSRKGSTRVP